MFSIEECATAPGRRRGGRVQPEEPCCAAEAAPRSRVLSRASGSGRVPDTYRLHLPPCGGDEPSPRKGCSIPAALCRWPTQGPDYPRLPGGPTATAVGLPARGAEGAGVGRRAELAASPASASAAPTCSGALAGNGACIAAATPTHSTTRSSSLNGLPPVSPNQPGTQNQVILGSVQAPARDPDSPSNVRSLISPQLSQQGRALNKAMTRPPQSGAEQRKRPPRTLARPCQSSTGAWRSPAAVGFCEDSTTRHALVSPSPLQAA
jgi:hypothetical protein